MCVNAGTDSSLTNVRNVNLLLEGNVFAHNTATGAYREFAASALALAAAARLLIWPLDSSN